MNEYKVLFTCGDGNHSWNNEFITCDWMKYWIYHSWPSATCDKFIIFTCDYHHHSWIIPYTHLPTLVQYLITKLIRWWKNISYFAQNIVNFFNVYFVSCVAIFFQELYLENLDNFLGVYFVNNLFVYVLIHTFWSAT